MTALTASTPTANQAAMGNARQDAVGLVGGRMDERLRHSRVPPLSLAHVLAPFRRPEDLAAFDAFVARRPLHVEIGFGRAHHLCELAAARPEASVLGFETRRQWCRGAARRAERHGLANLRVIEGDARSYLEPLVAAGTVDALHVLFPDPWWKRRHQKRRVFQPSFLALAHRLLAPGGWVDARTDVPAYAERIEALFASHDGFALAGVTIDDPELGALPRTHREKKCAELGISTFLFRFVKRPAPGILPHGPDPEESPS